MLSGITHIENDFPLVTETQFSDWALELFCFQYTENKIYQQYCNLLRKIPAHVKSIYDIPFLPVQFFKTHKVETTPFKHQLIFKSSGTGGD
ncbi:MAG TPA: acyl transferase, partial [Chitinophagaceae bacterium]|nr:acyl transferase [Chitinophagaceae bacterium]